MNGWIKLHRSLVGHPRYSDPEWLTVWVYLLLNAVYEVTEKLFDGRVVKLQPGQLVTGRHVIAVATGVHESKVFRILQQLKNEQQIEQQAGAKSSIITVLNWHRYQATEQQNEQPVNSKRTASEQQSNTIEESKKKKKE